MNTDNISPSVSYHAVNVNDEVPDSNGWIKYEFSPRTELDLANSDNGMVQVLFERVDEDIESTIIGDVSLGWSYQMPHSPDMELTQTFANESLKTVNTKSGVTLTNTGWNQPPMWGNYSQWKRSAQVTYPARRSWSLKFSYLADENSDNSGLMPQYYNELDASNHNRGIFERTSVTLDDPLTLDIDESSQSFSIKDDFLSKVMPSINLGLPFIFQPDSTVEEYAIARVNANSVTMNQVANNVYNISLDIVEVW